MDAMIFAAGLGTRLRPLTNDRPKALVEVAGVPVLERVARRLIDAGADRLIINTHHFSERVRDFVRSRDGFGVEVLLSEELDGPLDTGGGLARASTLFRRDRPVLLHNCDVLSNVDLQALVRAHTGDDAIATLAVLPTGTERYLVFDDIGLCGYAPRAGGDDVCRRETAGTTRRRDFTGIHVVAPRLLDTLPAGTYSIMNHYFRLIEAGERVSSHEQPGVDWLDIGSHEKLAAANDLFSTGR
jgi:NDP-sugar pyrophosphorylase family protein